MTRRSKRIRRPPSKDWSLVIPHKPTSKSASKSKNSLTGLPKILKKKKRGVRKRTSINKMLELIVMIREKCGCMENMKLFWMNMARKRSNTRIRRMDFSSWCTESEEAHDSGLLDEQNGGDDSENVVDESHEIVLEVDEDLNNGTETNVKPESIVPTHGVMSENVVPLTLTPEKDEKKSTNTHTPTSGVSDSLIDILKKRSTCGAEQKSKRKKTKKHRPKVLLPKKVTKSSTPKPRTPNCKEKGKRKVDLKLEQEMMSVEEKNKDLKENSQEEELKNAGSHEEELNSQDKESKPVKRKLDFLEYTKVDCDHESQEVTVDTNLDCVHKSPEVTSNKEPNHVELKPNSLSSKSGEERIDSISQPEMTDRDGVETNIPDLNLNTQVFSDETSREVLLDYTAETSKEALIDYVVRKMSSLSIDDDAFKQLVLHQWKSEHKKATVDLDDETTRVWDMLMENDWSESKEAEGADNPDHMRNERNLYRQRINSFLGLMHEIQGDRMFTPWKGSVVDSIVGVFLTQNVGDNLSSNAFMELASAYPPLTLSEQNSKFCCDELLKLCEPPSKEASSPPSQQESSPPPRQEVVRNFSLVTGIQVEQEVVISPRRNKGKAKKEEKPINWDNLRTHYCHGISRIRTEQNADSVNWERISQASAKEIADVIANRGMNNQLAGRIKNFLDRLIKDHGSIDLEWLRYVPPEKAKDFLLSISGLGLKSTECVRLLSLHFRSFPVDTNAGRFFVRVGWVPLKPLPDGLKFHLLNEYPPLDTVQKYMWPRICDRDFETLYDFHCHSITFSKAFCTKTRPNCSQCPMRRECRHYASAQASAQLHLEDDGELRSGTSSSSMQTQLMLTNSNGNESRENYIHCNTSEPTVEEFSVSPEYSKNNENYSHCNIYEPKVEFPASPEQAPIEVEFSDDDINDIEDIEDFVIPTIALNDDLSHSSNDCETSKALVVPRMAPFPMPPLKRKIRLRVEHIVYELPDSHPLLLGYETRVAHDRVPYLLAIWPDEPTNNSQGSDDKACVESSSREIEQYDKQGTIKGTILIPCRTTNRGRFPLNGTYFQNNEVFADHEGSVEPIDVPRECIEYLTKRILYCGRSITSICKSMKMENIVLCFRTSYICVRGFSRKTRRPMVLQNNFYPRNQV